MKKIISSLLAAAVISAMLTTVSAAEGIVNGDFSDGTNGWDTDGAAENGVLLLSGSSIAKQTVSAANGVYDLTASFTNTDASQNAYIYAKTGSAAAAKTVIPKSGKLTKVTVRGVKVTDGTVEIGVSAPKGGITADNFTLTPAPDKEVEFYKGGEISKLTYIESRGGKFRDTEGTERDALQIMAENGFNLARIRVLNNPGKGRGDGTYYLPEGFQDEKDCLELARRAKDKGMKIQFSFAYSDYWSDGGQQYIPAEWLAYITENNITDKQKLTDYLSEQVYEYTKKVMNDLIAQDTIPEFVSIGNEMQFGILFGSWKNHNGLYDSAAAKYQVQLISAGIKAVRETSPGSRIILHTDNGGNVSKRSLFYNTFLNQLDYDIIGVSYYPYYNKNVSIDTVINELNSMINKFNKDVIIMETGCNWSEKRGDGYEGQLQDSGYYQNIYGESKEGQHAFLTELYAKLKTNVTDGRCLGDLYWDPVMLYDGGTYQIGWAIKESDDWSDGNVVSNSNLFDFDGNALPSQTAMKYNTAMRPELLISGKTDKISSKINLTVNGISYEANTDKFGEYIAAVPYSDELDISLDDCEDTYSVAAPSDDFMVRNINFPAQIASPLPTETPSGFTYSPENGNVSLPSLPESGGTVIAAFYKDGSLTRAQSVRADCGTKSVKLPAAENGETVRVFLWDSVSGMRPIESIAEIIN